MFSDHGCQPAVFLCLLVLLFAPLAAVAADTPKHIVLVGDSTVTDNAGWGKAFADRLAPEVRCTNTAKGGASTKSFRDAKLWAKALALKPTHMLIQFGHNDMPGKGPNRETDPKTTYRENLSRFVDEARAAGAQPILVTSIPRRNFRDGKRDHTHLAPPGQKLTARLLIAELQQVVPELAPVFRTEK